MGYKCEKGRKRGCDTCKHDLYRKDFCPWCEKQPCPVLIEMVYPYGIEMCNQCDWEAKDGE
jgi:hypothetical protein